MENILEIITMKKSSESQVRVAYDWPEGCRGTGNIWNGVVDGLTTTKYANK